MQVVPEEDVSSGERPMTWGAGAHTPTNLLSCLELDRTAAGCPLVYRQRHIAQGLAGARSLNTADIRAHHGCVNAVTFSNLGEEFLATGGDDARVLVWRVAHVTEGKCQPNTMATIHQSNVFSIAFSCDNTIIYSAGNDSDVIKHDFASGRSLGVLPHNDVVYCVAAHPSSPHIILTASEEGSVHIIDTRLPRMTHDMILAEDLHAFQSVAFNPLEPRLVAMGNTHYGASLFDSRQRKRIQRYKSTMWGVNKEDVMSVCFNRAGTQLFTLQKHLPPAVFDIWEREPRYSFTSSDGSYRNSVTMKSGCFAGPRDEEEPGNGTKCLAHLHWSNAATSHHLQYIVSGSDDFRIHLWKIPDGEPVQIGYPLPRAELPPHLVLPGHRSIVNQVRYSPRHSLMCSSGVEKVVKLWSHLPLSAGSEVQRSGEPPSRKAYSSSEFIRLSLEAHDPSDSTQEDPSVLAFFDGLIERADRDNLLDTSSSSSPYDISDYDNSSPAYLVHHSDSESDLDSVVSYRPHIQWVELPDHWSDTTTSTLSPANTSSLEPPWSDPGEDPWDDDSSSSESGAEVKEDESEWERRMPEGTQNKTQDSNERAAGSLPGPSSENGSSGSLPARKRVTAFQAKGKQHCSQPHTYCREDFLKPIPPTEFYSSSQGSLSRQPVCTLDSREDSSMALGRAGDAAAVADHRNSPGDTQAQHGFQEKIVTRRDEVRTVELESGRNGGHEASGVDCVDEGDGGSRGPSANGSSKHKPLAAHDKTTSTVSNGSSLKSDPSVL